MITCWAAAPDTRSETGKGRIRLCENGFDKYLKKDDRRTLPEAWVYRRRIQGKKDLGWQPKVNYQNL